MKNKAFTLVELLAVIAIIGITSTFVLINTNKKKEEYSKISNDEIKEIIRVSTHSSSEEISNKVKSSTSGYEIKLDDLIEKGYISDEKLKNFETNKDINTKNVTIIVTYGLNDEGTAYEYQYQINGIK